MFEKTRIKGKAEVSKAVQNIVSNVMPSQSKQKLAPLVAQFVSQKGQTPYQTILDTQANLYFLKTDYNYIKQAQAYRSPYSNFCFPQQKQQSNLQPRPLRELQQKGNILFGQYTRLYYGGEKQNAIGNFFASQSEDGLVFAFVCQKKFLNKKTNTRGQWNSTNTIQIRGDRSKNVTYKLQTSIIYQMSLDLGQALKKIDIFGSLKKNRVDTKKLSENMETDEFHLMVAGKMVEQVETVLTQQITSIFLSKTKDVLFRTRQEKTLQYQEHKRKMASNIQNSKPQKYKGEITVLNK